MRVRLRRAAAPYIGTRVLISRIVTFPDGTGAAVHPGDWLVSLGSAAPFDVIPSASFPGPYEVVTDSALTLSRAYCEALERTTGIGTTRTPAVLLAAVQRLARLSIGSVDLPFTPGQLEELKARADKRGQTLQQALQAVVDRIKDEIFWKG